MIISQARKVHASDPSTWAWAALRKFQNIDVVADKLSQIHKVDARWRENVRKQAQQLRYCMIQAREYFIAAQAVSIATKPNLLYYGAMSLALAEILFKQSGDSSLDRARSEHRHHGLSMTAGGIPKGANLQLSASHLRALPVEIEGERRGTFELWHRTSREHPLAGIARSNLEGGGQTEHFQVIMGAIDSIYSSIPINGLTLADCLSAIPMMSEHVSDAGLVPQFARGRCQSQTWHGTEWHSTTHITFHPNPLNTSLFNGIIIAPSAINYIEFAEVGTGLNIVINNNAVVGNVSLPLPPASMVNADEWRMWTNAPPLNEFGYLYVALFIAGNYARYFPDRWLTDVEKSTPLALAIEHLCCLAEWRVPWLSLCELEMVLFVNDV